MTTIAAISPRTLALCRRTSARFFDKTATIQRVDETRDTGGGTIDTFSDHATLVPCRKTIAGSEDELVISARESEVVTWAVYLPWDTDLLVTDRLIIDGETLEVKGTNRRQSDAVNLRALCVIAS